MVNGFKPQRGLVTRDKTPYKLDCGSCRKSSFLTQKEYALQLDDKNSDGWICPHCGSGDSVTFDEVNYQTIMGVNRKTF
jgi:hypothetical protein